MNAEPDGPEADDGKPFRYAREVFLTVSALALVAVVILAQGVLLPFLLAVLVAYVLFPAVTLVEKIKVPRWGAILIVYAVAIGSMVGFAVVVVPRLFDETKALSAELPKLTQRVRDDWLPELDARLAQWTGATPSAETTAPEPKSAPIVLQPREDGSYEVLLEDDLEIRPEGEGWRVGPKRGDDKSFSSARALRDAFDSAIAYAQKNSLELIAVGRRIVGGISRGVFYFFITLMLAGYMMQTYERIHEFLRALWPKERRAAFDRFLRRLDHGLAGVVRGQLLICLVNGVLSAIGFWIFDLKYWPILSLIAAIMSIIPIFGSILSTIPAVAIGLTQSPGTAIGVLVWIVAIHQLEANFLNPKIIGDAAKIHPVLVVFALLLGEHLFSITGALLAVPCLALVQAVFLHFRESVLGIPARISLTPAAASSSGALSVDVDLELASTDADADAAPTRRVLSRPRRATKHPKTPLIRTKRSAIADTLPAQAAASDETENGDGAGPTDAPPETEIDSEQQTQFFAPEKKTEPPEADDTEAPPPSQDAPASADATDPSAELSAHPRRPAIKTTLKSK